MSLAMSFAMNLVHVFHKNIGFSMILHDEFSDEFSDE